MNPGIPIFQTAMQWLIISSLGNTLLPCFWRSHTCFCILCSYVFITMWLTVILPILFTLFWPGSLMIFTTPKPVWLTGGSHCNPFKCINCGLATGTLFSRTACDSSTCRFLSLYIKLQQCCRLRHRTLKPYVSDIWGFPPLGFVSGREIWHPSCSFTDKGFIHTT